MARPTGETLTGREAQLMDAVWRLGAATAEAVREALPEPLHDSTVRTLLRVLESKGYLRHEVRGKAYVYRAAVAREKAQRRALRSVLARFFGGSAEDLVLRLIEDERITPEQFDALNRVAGFREVTKSQSGRAAREAHGRQAARGRERGKRKGESP
jgi:predicted transcriptional regulator